MNDKSFIKLFYLENLSTLSLGLLYSKQKRHLKFLVSPVSELNLEHSLHIISYRVWLVDEFQSTKGTALM